MKYSIFININEVMMIKCNLSTILGAKRMTRSELSVRSGLSMTSIKPFYDDTWKGVRRDTLEVLCKALQVNINELFEYVDEV